MNSNVQAALPFLVLVAFVALVALVPFVRGFVRGFRMHLSLPVPVPLPPQHGDLAAYFTSLDRREERRRVRETATHLLCAWSTGNPGVLDATMVASAYQCAELIVANENVSPEAQLEVAGRSEAEYRADLDALYRSHGPGDALKPRDAE